MRFLAQGQRRRPASIHQQRGRSGVDALIAGMRRIRHWRAAGVVVSEHGGEQIDRRRTHAVELREIAVGMAEKTLHRHHAIDGVVERLRRLQVARGEQLAQRQQVHQQFDERAGIAADVSAVGQDLPPQFLDQAAGMAAQVAGLPLQVFGDGDQERDFVYVSDVVDAIILSLGDSSMNGVWNVGTGVATTVNKLAAQMLGAFNSSCGVERLPERYEIRRSCLDVSKLERTDRWSAKVTLMHGLQMLAAQIASRASA